MSEMTTARLESDYLEMVLGCKFDVPAVLIDAERREVRAIEAPRSEEEIARLMLEGEQKLTMANYECEPMGRRGGVILHLSAVAYWNGCLQPEHRQFFKMEGKGEPFVWRALIVGDNTCDLHEHRRRVQYIDEAEAYELFVQAQY